MDVPWKVDGASLLQPRVRERYLLVGDRETFRPDVDELLARRATVVREQTSLFGIGPNPELLGRTVSELDVAQAVGVSAQIQQAGQLRAVDLDAAYVPVRLTGRIDGGTGRRDLAVAVNGRIEAVARSYVAEGEERVSVLFPESALRQGANDVRIYWVSGAELREIWSS